MKKFVNFLALGALAGTLVIATGCNKAEEAKPVEEAPKVVEETTSTTTTSTVPTTGMEATGTEATTVTTETTASTTTVPATN